MLKRRLIRGDGDFVNPDEELHWFSIPNTRRLDLASLSLVSSQFQPRRSLAFVAPLTA